MKRRRKRKIGNPDYSAFNSVVEVLENCMLKYTNLMAITDEYSKISMSYEELIRHINWFACGLQCLGIKKSDKIAIFSENNGRWIVVDQGILKCGAVDAVRGSNAPVEELLYITVHSDSKAMVVKDFQTLNKLKDGLKEIKLDFIIVMFSEKPCDYSDLSTPVFTYEEILEKGKNIRFKPVKMDVNDDMTILYTSGTTGVPKGVLLSHKNIITLIESCHSGFISMPGENTLQILPIWHAYEKIGQYYYLSRGCHLHFTTLNNLKADLARYKIDTMMSVPRIWEAMRNGIYQKLKQKSKFWYAFFDFAIKVSIGYKTHKMYGERRITNKLNYNAFSTVKHRIIRSFLKPMHVLFSATIYKKLKKVAGLNFRATLSGGGALSMQDELFYDAMGVDLRTGYGLTETSPVLTLRSVQDKNYLGSAGKAVPHTELKIVDPQTFEPLGKFKKGLVMVRGPQIMKGYYKDEEATKAVLSEDGWFNTGDLGWLTNENNLVLVGRLKETIVLSSGENVEPVPIEEACLISPYIEQMVLVGQDQSGVGAIIVPSKEALEKCGINMKNLKSHKDETLIDNSALQALIKKELNTHVSKKPNLRVFEKIKQFALIKENFSIENGLLSASGKMKRNKIFEKYKDLISKMYKKD